MHPVVPAQRTAAAPSRSDDVSWALLGRCGDRNPDELFVSGAAQRDVRDVCRPCPVRTECLAYALDERIEFGVWGGMTERERRAVLRRNPDVTSWREVLDDARAAAQSQARSDAGSTAQPQA